MDDATRALARMIETCRRISAKEDVIARLIVDEPIPWMREPVYRRWCRERNVFVSAPDLRRLLDGDRRALTRELF
jgi:hypothetical protein